MRKKIGFGIIVWLWLHFDRPLAASVFSNQGLCCPVHSDQSIWERLSVENAIAMMEDWGAEMLYR